MVVHERCWAWWHAGAACKQFLLNSAGTNLACSSFRNMPNGSIPRESIEAPVQWSKGWGSIFQGNSTKSLDNIIQTKPSRSGKDNWFVSQRWHCNLSLSIVEDYQKQHYLRKTDPLKWIMWLQHLWCSILTSKVQSSKTIAICSGIYQMLGYMRKIQLLATPLDFRKLSSFPPVHDMHYGILIPKLKQKTRYRPRSSEPKASTLLTWLEEQNGMWTCIFKLCHLQSDSSRPKARMCHSL